MAVELKTNVVIGGQTTAGFNALAGKIQQIGSIIDQVGSKVRDWEKESLETYKNYETYMLEAKGAMSAQYETTGELERAYSTMEQKAQEWAASTIFHTNDVSKAISEAAHAGWSLDEMLTGIPGAMELAQAGNLDLSTGLDMLIKNINGLGLEFSDSKGFIDQWVMAANSSATTVGELGEAMERMGATARFGDSSGELLTMLAVLADTGTTGAAAGTLLRNSMIRLIAPTKTATGAMKELSIEAADYEEAVGSDAQTLSEVNSMLKAVGFSAYKDTGELKPFLTIFKELNAATKNMTEQDRNKVLSAIFPTRTITGALALLEAAANDYDGLLEKILASGGYAAEVAETQTSGLMGAEEIFASKWEEFSRKVGETLSEPVEGGLSWLGEQVDKLNNLDEATLSALVGGLTTIAGLGPALMIGGAAIKAFTALGPVGAAAVFAAVSIGTLASYLTKVNQLALENNFGQMSIDLNAVKSTLGEVGTELAQKFSDLNEYSSAAKQAATDYQEAGTLLAEGLTTKMITGAEVTEADKTKLENYGKTMIESLKNGITIATAEKMELASLLFSESEGTDSDTDLANNPYYASIISLLETGMGDAKSRAAELSKELRDALTSAFADGQLSEAELANIQSIMDQMNELMAGLSPSDTEKNKLLLKSQRTSLESMKEFSDEVNQAREAAFAGMDEEMLDMQAQLMTYYDWAVEHGQKIIDPATGQYVDASSVNINDLIKSTQDQYEAKRTTWERDYDDMLRRGWDNALRTSDTGDFFAEAGSIIGNLQAGWITSAEATKQIADIFGADAPMLAKSMDEMFTYFGGAGEMQRRAREYREMGGAENEERAAWYENMLYMRQALGGPTNMVNDIPTTEGRQAVREMVNALADVYNAADAGYIPDGQEAIEAYQRLTNEQKAAWDAEVGKLRETYDLGAIAEEYGGGDLDAQLGEWLGAYLISHGKVQAPEDYLWGEEEPTIPVKPEIDEDADLNIEDLLEEDQIIKVKAELDEDDVELDIEDLIEEDQKLPVDLETEDAEAKLGDLQDQAEEIVEDPLTLEMDTEEAEEKVAGVGEAIDGLGEREPVIVLELDSSAVDEWEKEDTTSLHTIGLEDGTAGWSPPGDTSSTHTIYIKTVGGGVGGGRSGSGGGGGGNVVAALYAEGGRATEPSIFGEGDTPEWAIPEEHSERTASLLNQAREASGFTWDELIGLHGGLNGGTGVTVNIGSYSPVINANDASGVEQALAEDKARLTEIVQKAVKTAMAENRLRDAVEVYA